MYNVLLIAHIVVVLVLLGIILIQRGRSGGLIEALGGVESIFGTKTNAMLVKVTVVLAALFFITSITLAILSKERGKSLMDRYQEPASEEEASSQEDAPASDLAEQEKPAATDETPADQKDPAPEAKDEKK